MPSSLRLPLWLQWLLLSALLLGMVLWLGRPGQLQRSNAWLQDVAIRMHSQPAAAEVVLVLADDRSIDTIGRWPWRRALHAQVVRHINAGQPQSIGLDILFTEEDLDYPEDDWLLAQTLAASGRVVLPILPSATQGTQYPLPALAQAAAALGHSQIPMDADGSVRRFYAWEGPTPQRWPHWSIAMQCVEHPQLPLCQPPPSPAAGPLRWQRQEERTIGFASVQPRFTRYAYIDVLQGRIPASAFRNKHVLIGASATGVAVQQSTPGAPGQPSMSPVELQAHILHGNLTASHLQAAPAWVNYSLQLGTVGLGLLALLLLGPSAALLVCVGLGVGSVLLHFLAAYGGWVLSPGAALVGLASAYPLWSWRRQSAALNFLRHEMHNLSQQGLPPPAPARTQGDFMGQHIAAVEQALHQLRHLQTQREQAMRFISHDIRAPISAILTDMELEQHQLAPPNGPPLLTRIERSAHNALRLADDFVHLARTLEHPSAQRQPVELGLLIEQALDDVWAAASARQVQWLWLPQEQEALCLGDPSQLRRVLVNLLSNAIKYGPEAGQIAVQLHNHPDGWHITVHDQGNGIQPHELPRLFTPFARQHHHENGPVAGIGLGLAYVHTVITQHGGSVNVHNHHTGGAVFTVQLPHCPASAATQNA